MKYILAHSLHKKASWCFTNMHKSSFTTFKIRNFNNQFLRSKKKIPTILLIGWYFHNHSQVDANHCRHLDQSCNHHQINSSVFSQINTLKPRKNGRHFADIFKCIFMNENAWISIEISLKFVPKGPINNITALVQIMAWCRPGATTVWANDS